MKEENYAKEEQEKKKKKLQLNSKSFASTAERPAQVDSFMFDLKDLAIISHSWVDAAVTRKSDMDIFAAALERSYPRQG